MEPYTKTKTAIEQPHALLTKKQNNMPLLALNRNIAEIKLLNNKLQTP